MYDKIVQLKMTRAVQADNYTRLKLYIMPQNMAPTVIQPENCHSDRREESKMPAVPNLSYRQDFRPFTIVQGDIAIGKGVWQSNFSPKPVCYKKAEVNRS